VDNEVAQRVLVAERESVRRAMVLRQANMVEGVQRFIQVADAVKPRFSSTLYSRMLVPRTWGNPWAARLAGEENERSSMEAVLRRVASLDVPIASLAQRLLRRLG
jgi:hypothetical protein